VQNARPALIALLFGALLGLGAHALSTEFAFLSQVYTYGVDPLARLFLRMLLLPVLPLIFSALVLTLCEVDREQLTQLGRRTLLYTLCMSAIAAALGVGLVNLVQPGAALRQRGLATAAELPAAALPAGPERPLPETLLALVPSNPLSPFVNGDVLGVVFLAILFGAALAGLRGEGGQTLRAAVRGVYEVSLRVLGWVLWLLPAGILLLTYSVTYRLGPDVLGDLGLYLAVVVVGLCLQLFGVYGVSVRVFGGLSPRVFFVAIRAALVTAFATASSSATFPVALKVAEENLELPPRVTRFVLSAGAMLNQNGTALYEGVTLLFLAQAYGVELGPAQQLGVMGVSLLSGIGAVGIPGASAPALAAVASVFGIPLEGVALVLGLDRVLDMCRTTVNVAGDLAAAVFVAAREQGRGSGASTPPPSGEPSAL
jgi:dicarboxylate/amino acid:cation (Na+ or H+) symporter, DAACS family